MNVVAYARFSSENQREQSIDEQLREIDDYCKKYGHTIIRHYTDYALSGKFSKRPQFDKMIDDSASRDFQAVVVFDLSRFSRGGDMAIVDEVRLRHNGVRVLSVTEEFGDDFGGKLIKTVKYLSAEEDLVKLSNNVKRGQRDNALNALWNGGTPPLGYNVDRDTQKLIIDPTEAEAVKIIFSDYAAGMSTAQICQKLNALGFRTKRNKNEFGKSSLHDILRNEKYIGNYVYRKIKEVKSPFGNKVIRRDRSEIICLENGVPAIIDEDTWDKCQERILLRSFSSNRAKIDYLLTGLMRCAECGKAYVGGGSRGKFNLRETNSGYKGYFYVCTGKKNAKNCKNRNISKRKTENAILNLIRDEIYSAKNIKRIIKEFSAWQKVHSSVFTKEISVRKAELNKYEQQKQRLLSYLLDGTIEQAQYTEKMRELTQNIRAAEAALERLKVSDRLWTEEDLLEFFEFQKNTPPTDTATLKEYIHRHVAAIEVGEKYIKVKLVRFPFLDAGQKKSTPLCDNTQNDVDTLVEMRGVEPLTS